MLIGRSSGSLVVRYLHKVFLLSSSAMLRPWWLACLLSFLHLKVVELHLIFGEVGARSELFFLRSCARVCVALSRWDRSACAVGCRCEYCSVVCKEVIDLLILSFDDTSALWSELLVDLRCQSGNPTLDVGRWNGVRLLVNSQIPPFLSILGCLTVGRCGSLLIILSDNVVYVLVVLASASLALRWLNDTSHVLCGLSRVSLLSSLVELLDFICDPRSSHEAIIFFVLGWNSLLEPYLLCFRIQFDRLLSLIPLSRYFSYATDRAGSSASGLTPRLCWPTVINKIPDTDRS